jgi:alkanesulfonate monooxygenase SsuD/methylene tetrahydromethanopterin reductase-like flavin-dependent oxidoreductase (luciferase family)
LADGWLAQGSGLREPVARLRRYAEEAGRPADAIDVVATLRLEQEDPETWAREAAELRADGVTQIAIGPPANVSVKAALRLLLAARETVSLTG